MIAEPSTLDAGPYEDLVDTPIVDFLVIDENPDNIIVVFVPDLRIYGGGRSAQKESVFINPATPVGLRVLELLGRLGDALAMASPPVRLGHGGGDDFIVFDRAGETVQLPDACRQQRDVALQVYAILGGLGQEAQLEFLNERRRALVAAAG